jgi:hypothetical protein
MRRAGSVTARPADDWRNDEPQTKDMGEHGEARQEMSDYKDERMLAIIARCGDSVDAADFKAISEELGKARHEQMEKDCKAMCVFCRKGQIPEKATRKPFVGIFVHDHGSNGWMPDACSASPIRRAFEEGSKQKGGGQ